MVPSCNWKMINRNVYIEPYLSNTFDFVWAFGDTTLVRACICVLINSNLLFLQLWNIFDDNIVLHNTIHSHMFTLEQFNCLVAPSSGHFVSYTNISLFEVKIFRLILKWVPGVPISVKFGFQSIGGLQTVHSGLKIVFSIKKCQFLTISSQFFVEILLIYQRIWHYITSQTTIFFLKFNFQRHSGLQSMHRGLKIVFFIEKQPYFDDLLAIFVWIFTYLSTNLTFYHFSDHLSQSKLNFWLIDGLQ